MDCLNLTDTTANFEGKNKIRCTTPNKEKSIYKNKRIKSLGENIGSHFHYMIWIIQFLT